MDMTEQPVPEPAQKSTNGDGASPSAPPNSDKAATEQPHPEMAEPSDQKSAGEPAAQAKPSNTGGGKGDSEAETEILSGKEEGSKQKSRKAIKLEQPDTVPTLEQSDDKNQALDNSARLGARQTSLKRKRGAEEPAVSDGQEDRDSSKLSSTISSPVIDRRTSDDIESKSEHSESSPPLDAINQKPGFSTHEREKSEKSRPPKYKDDKESVNSRKRRETRSATDLDDSTNRSTSPPSRKPHRVFSAQSNVPQIQGAKKRRKAPAPLQVDRRSRPSEDAQDSDSSSVRSHHRGQPLNSAADNTAMWRTNKVSAKRNKDRSGRTLLARACATDLQEAEKWLKERPEDIDVDDNAGNTPLQIASLEGSADIVKLLIDHGCRTDCKNVDNDTPLIDAVENGHLDVVRLLLAAGVDPNQRNATGKEPIELVNSETDDCDQIRAALLISKKEKENKRRQSEDQSRNPNSASREPESSLSINSGPSPTHSTKSPPLDPSARRRTARSQHTNDSLLWVNPTPQRLRDAAGKGDATIVNYILNMRPQADAEAVLAAAQGGHDEILGLILAIAQPESDPAPLRSPDLKPGHTTPMLAAIGRGNIKVLRLLLDQPGFDPTRRPYKNLTYFELAKERQSSEWRDEYNLLKEAFDQYKKHGGRKSNQSTPQKSRSKRNESRKSSPEPPPYPQERKIRKSQLAVKDEQDAELRRKPTYQGTASRQPEEHRRTSLASSDHEGGEPRRKDIKINKRVRSASPSQPALLKPKRRLISGNDVKIDQEARRKALAAETLNRRRSGEPAEGKIAKIRRPSDASASAPVSRKSKSASPTRAKDETSKKRLRNSVSPRNSRSDFGEEVKKKKRLRIDSEGNAKDQVATNALRPGPAPPANMVPSPPVVSSPSATGVSSTTAPIAFMGSATSSPKTKSHSKDSPSEGPTRSPVSSPTGSTGSKPQMAKRRNIESSDGAFDGTHDVKMEDPAEDEQQKQARLEKEKAEREEIEARQKEEAELQRQIQREKEAAEQAARIAREEEEARQEAERLRLEEERRIQKEREEAEALQAKKRRDEEMQRRRLEQEKQRREEQERRRRELEERETLRALREQQERERLRREALPNGLRRYFELSPEEARLAKEISRWLPLRTVTTMDLDPNCEVNVAEDRWIANVQAAPLLANKDLELSQCKSLRAPICILY